MNRTFFDVLEDVSKMNDFHDELGRFAEKGTGKASPNAESKSSSKEHKQKQFDIISSSNAAEDDYHTWIRGPNEIFTFNEVIDRDCGSGGDYEDCDEFAPDYTLSMAKRAIESGKITVYSSHDIENGTFVTPSKMEAESYGGGKCNKKEVNIADVAWIDAMQGQYAKIN